MAFICVAREPRNYAPRAVLPIRRVETRERWHEIDSSIVVDRSRQILDVRTFLDEAEVVAQPLHQGPGDGDTSLQRVLGRLVAKLVSQGSKQTMFRLHQAAPGIHEQKAASPVGVLGFSRLKAGLPHQGRLLV